MIKEKQTQLSIFKQSEVDRLMKRLTRTDNIVITTHRNPDGDAMGSSLALALVLRKAGHKVTVLTPNPYDYFLHWMPTVRDTVFADRDMATASEIINDAGLIFCLDYNALHRVGEMGDLIGSAVAPAVLIDHHLEPEDFAQYNFHIAGISSTAELVYRLLLQLGYTHHIDADVATCLYVGLMTDTGSFRFSTTTADVHRIVANLLEHNIEVGAIHNRIFDNYNESRVRFLGYVLYQKLQVLPEYHTAYMTVSLDEIEKFDLKAGDTEGFVNYGLSMRGINFAVLIKESIDGTKLSLRSIGSFPCNTFAAHFGGGGHHNASGGRVDMSLAETEQKFRSLLEVYRSQLKY
ncbi:MAG: bifunctional oligoribonuclease/PAP phosphatase NrnA [Bacteroidota bacterium]